MTDHDSPPPGDDRGPHAASGDDAERFDAAFEGPAWSQDRRRPSSRSSSRSSSTGSSGTTSSTTPGPATADEGRGVRRRSRTPRWSKVRAVAVHAVVGLVVVGVVWVVVTAVLAAWQLQQARSDLTALRAGLTSGGSDALTSTASSLVTHAHRAQVLTSGPAWAVATHVPWVGGPFESVQGITRETSSLVEAAAPGIVAVADDVDPRTAIRGDTVDLQAVRTSAPAIHTAAETAIAARAAVAELPRSTWLPPVDSAAAEFRDQVSELAGTLHATDQAFQVLPTMLGGDGVTRRYFVSFQNNAELRGTGGLPGAFAIVAATNGTVTVERFESDSLLINAQVTSGLSFGAAYDAHWGPSAAATYPSSNQDPHFPYAAQIWQSMWSKISGQQVDGALTVDPAALSYLLAATGPTSAPDGQAVTADNVVKLLQVDAYAKFPDVGENDDRRNYVLGIAEAAEKKILAGGGNTRALLSGLARSVSERRIVAWSSDPGVQEVLAATTIGGTVPRTTEPFSQLVVNNGNGGKLDYYLGRSVTVERSGCGDTRDVTVTVKLTNNAPPSGLPPYVTSRVNVAEPPGYVVGQNREVVDYVATAGAQLLGTTVDGAAATAGVYDEEGHPSFQTILEIKPGQTVTWVIRLQEPAGNQPYTVVKQPAVQPIDVAVDDRSCS